MLHVEIGCTVCEKREHSRLDSCHFQRKKKKPARGMCPIPLGYPLTAGDSWPSLAV